MLATYASFLLILGLAALVGQAVFALCGRRTWSRLSPAVGLAALCAVAWGAVRLPGDGAAATVAILVLGAVAALLLRGRLEDLPRALRIGVPVELAAVVLASLPFIVEGRFGILGTGLNPDMSQHLFAANLLAHGADGGRLINAGYPLGPHSLVVAVSKLGPSSVHAFDGLTIATAVSACLAPLAVVWRLSAARRLVGALVVGLSYMFASYLVQGAFKELLEALFLLTLAIGLHQLAAGELTPPTAPSALRAAPLAVLAIGAVYSYSFPGLFWLFGAAGLWAAAELAAAYREDDRSVAASLRSTVRPALAALGVLVVAAAPEIGRMIDFGGFQTFNPHGAGLGNLFNRISPLEALGIWPSGDFRVEPGDGFAPAIAFWIGSAVALAALAWGLSAWLRRRELAVPSALAAATLLVLYALVAGTPYQEAKAIAIVSPLAVLVAVRPALELGLPARPSRRQLALATLGAAFVVGCAASSILALANGPVGPSVYSPALTALRGSIGERSTLVLASPELLADAHGRDYLVWELRGGRVCVGEPGSPRSLPSGVSYVITQDQSAPFPELRLARRSGGYFLWARSPLPAGAGPCPLIAPGGARANPAEG